MNAPIPELLTDADKARIASIREDLRMSKITGSGGPTYDDDDFMLAIIDRLTAETAPEEGRYELTAEELADMAAAAEPPTPAVPQESGWYCTNGRLRDGSLCPACRPVTAATLPIDVPQDRRKILAHTQAGKYWRLDCPDGQFRFEPDRRKLPAQDSLVENIAARLSVEGGKYFRASPEEAATLLDYIRRVNR